MVSDAGTLLIFITLIVCPFKDYIDLLSTEVETKNSNTSPLLPHPLKGFTVSEPGCKSTLSALYFIFLVSLAGRQ